MLMPLCFFLTFKYNHAKMAYNITFNIALNEHLGERISRLIKGKGRYEMIYRYDYSKDGDHISDVPDGREEIFGEMRNWEVDRLSSVQLNALKKLYIHLDRLADQSRAILELEFDQDAYMGYVRFIGTRESVSQEDINSLMERDIDLGYAHFDVTVSQEGELVMVTFHISLEKVEK